MYKIKKLPCTIMRGGTSKAVFFNKEDLPASRVEIEKLLLNIMGSPDPRQIDGLGGGDILTSKVAIIEKSKSDDFDVNYTFAQVDISEPMVSFEGNCGNISSAVGPYAVDKRLVIPKEPYTTVRIHNTNTDRLIIAKVPVKDDKFNPIGNYSISGVPGTGSRIALDFSDSIGTLGKGLLPTGKPKDILDVPDFGKITVSIVDAANPVLFVRASDINKNCTESIDMIKADTEFLDLSEMIRGTAATLLGLVDNPQDAREKSPFLPFFVYVAPPIEYITMFGAKILEGAYDIAARLIGFGAPHRAFPGTGAICTGAAAAISGTLVNEILRAGKKKKSLVIGHSSGTIKTESNIEVSSEGEIEKIFVGISRTARMIMDGVVHLK